MNDIEYLKKYLKSESLKKGIDKLNQGIPVQYIVGNVNFYGYEFEVNENVLIPRFETEELVNLVIKESENFTNPSILDIGTGSGCIAITLNKEINGSKVTAVDISTKALATAKTNNTKLNGNVNFIESDILSNVTGKYDIIVSNPPYIDRSEKIDTLVYNNEPHLALFADNNGLYFYEEILKNIDKYLNEKFIIAFEIGHLQGQALIDLANKYLINIEVEVIKDLQKRDRIVLIKSK